MTELLAVMTITILAVVSPGPDFAMVTRNSMLLSRRAGVLTALGIAAGVWVHVTYTLLGVGLLIRQSLLLFTMLKLVGAAYLIWLGIRMLRAKPAQAAALTERPALSDLGALRMGFLTNALNPKTTIFVVSLFMQVVQPTTALPAQMAYGAFISAAHLIWFAIVALFFSSATVRLRLLALRHWIDRAFGALLVGFGALLATASVTR
ncbi:LysE family transporter [Ensifer adhaerens]|uniref:LysE family transporter n=1 Tax=Ensifer adhaerens TaxID=106592 RepID=UPI00098F67A8|nr:LysE family transporter [Ensifer adhaerens]